MKTLLIIPDGTGIRNFLCTPFIEYMLERGPVVVWHDLPEESIGPFQEKWAGRVSWHALPPMHDGRMERLLRQAKIFAQLYWQRRSEPVPGLRRRSTGGWRTRWLERMARGIGRACAQPGRILWLDRMHLHVASRALHMEDVRHLLKDEKPSVSFCTHQRSWSAVAPMLASQEKGIPTATFIYSWDNVPKGRMAVPADYYLVWSDHMKEELLRYYPDVQAGRVIPLGTPQFEHYFNPGILEPRESFLRRHGLDPALPVVCFSGDDVTTSPHDPVYLAHVAEGIRGLPAGHRPQILLRRCPVDGSGRFKSVVARYPEIAVSDPLWKSAGREHEWSRMVPTPEDAALLVNVVAHCDAVINVGSTMAMDFAIMNKPGIFFGYNPPEANGGWDIHRVYQLPHFKSVHRLQPVHWAANPWEVGLVVLHALRNPEEKRAAREAWLRLIVRQPMDQASRRFADTVGGIGDSGARAFQSAGFAHEST